MARGPLRETIRLSWIRLHAASYWRYYEWKRGLAEPELALLPALCSREGLSVDIGANIGLYSFHLLNLSGSVIAFEPLPPMANVLRKAYRRSGARYRLEQFALSDREADVQIRMPRHNFGYSTMEPANVLEGKVDTSDIVTFDIHTRCLDTYKMDNIAFIKIDVEGHEESVLLGAKETLVRCRPSVLVEVEDCHKPGAVASIHEFMTGLGYGAYFLKDHSLRPFAEFNLATQQDRKRPENYIRNFLYLTEDAKQRVEDLLSKPKR